MFQFQSNWPGLRIIRKDLAAIFGILASMEDVERCASIGKKEEETMTVTRSTRYMGWKKNTSMTYVCKQRPLLILQYIP